MKTIAEGRVAPGLSDLAVQEQAGLVVTGRSHVTGLTELVHGSVNSHVAHHAPCPTVMVPAERRAA